ncbi:MAG: PASTA domain-containing protein [Planctomycetaceae bacterium]
MRGQYAFLPTQPVSSPSQTGIYQSKQLIKQALSKGIDCLMIVRCTICVALCAALMPEFGFAQSSRPTRPPGGRATTGAQRASRPPQRASRVPAQQASMRRTQAPSVRPVSPELDALLKEWEVSSARVTKLSGEHRRRVYDMVFKVEKVSMGQFYHEIPDKGRIDIEPVKIAEGATSNRKGKDGKPFALISDMQEKWICDGKRIIEVNEPEKSATFMSIPPRGQGENIMNGPLPFLFGMEAEKAKQRYQLKLISDKANPSTGRREIQIQAFPRWATDGQNWHEARIILDHPTFLPLHVKLVDSGKTKETVFSFRNLKVNGRVGILDKWMGNSPFKPKLQGYKINTLSPGKGATAAPVGKDEVMVPNIVHFSVEDARQRLQQAGFVVEAKFKRGGPAPMPRLIHKVAGCLPKPNTAVKRGSRVQLVVFERPKTARK